MPAIDFQEIPPSNSGDGQQDAFELFAQAFLSDYGLSIEQSPGRGADNGRDLLVIEKRTGVVSEVPVKWLVSCKHYAHSGKSVGIDDEQNIGDRVRAAGADGFLAFYSTLPSSPLINRLRELQPKLQFAIFDRGRIEGEILKASDGDVLFKRFFPKSHESWGNQNPTKPELFIWHSQLTCKHCRKDLLAPEQVGRAIISWQQAVGAYPNQRPLIKDFHWCCRGACDRTLRQQFNQKAFANHWIDLDGLTHPTLFVREITRFFDILNSEFEMDADSLESLSELVTITFHSVARPLTAAEESIARDITT